MHWFPGKACKSSSKRRKDGYSKVGCVDHRILLTDLILLYVFFVKIVMEEKESMNLYLVEMESSLWEWQWNRNRGKKRHFMCFFNFLKQKITCN